MHASTLSLYAYCCDDSDAMISLYLYDFMASDSAVSFWRSFAPKR